MSVGLRREVSLGLFIDPYKFSLVCYWMHSEHWTVNLDNKVTIFYKNNGYITVTPICSNKWLLIVDREFFLSLSRQHPGNFVSMNPLTIGSSGWIVLFLICGSFKNNVGTERIDEQSENTFGTITRIRPNIITFGTTNIVHNGITFGVGISTKHQSIGPHLTTFGAVPSYCYI